MLPAEGSASTGAIVTCSTCPITAILGELLTMFVMINQSCKSPSGEGSSSKYRIPSADYARNAMFLHPDRGKGSALLRLEAERPQEHANEQPTLAVDGRLAAAKHGRLAAFR